MPALHFCARSPRTDNAATGPADQTAHVGEPLVTIAVGAVMAALFGALFIRYIPAAAATLLAGFAVLALDMNNAFHLLA